MRILGDIFVPIIPVIAATGLFLGLKGVVFNDNVLGLFGTTTAIIPDYIKLLVNVLTETAFAFLPAIICWSAYKVFGGMPVIGLVIGLLAYWLRCRFHLRGLLALTIGIELVLLSSTMVTLTHGTMPVFMLAEPVILVIALAVSITIFVKSRKHGTL